MSDKKKIKKLRNQLDSFDFRIDELTGKYNHSLTLTANLVNDINLLKKDIHELKQATIEKMPEGASKEFAKKFGVK